MNVLCQRTTGHGWPGCGCSARPFSPFAYTLDLLRSIINLGQENAWSAHGPGQAMAYILIVAGWVLVTAVIAGTTRVLSRP